MTQQLVIGELTFAEQPHLPDTAVAYVRLLDVSLADAPSTIIAEQVLGQIARDANAGKPIAFTLRGRAYDSHASYSVSAHVDTDGDGKVSVGDYISMQSYPVLTHGYANQVTILVKRVR